MIDFLFNIFLRITVAIFLKDYLTTALQAFPSTKTARKTSTLNTLLRLRAVLILKLAPAFQACSHHRDGLKEEFQACSSSPRRLDRRNPGLPYPLCSSQAAALKTSFRTRTSLSIQDVPIDSISGQHLWTASLDSIPGHHHGDGLKDLSL